MKRYFEGDEAATNGDTTQNILMDYLRDQLKVRADALALCPEGVLVTQSLSTARARFKSQSNQAFVLIQEGDGSSSEYARIRVEDEAGNVTVYRGAHHTWAFDIQLSARNDEAARTGPSNATALDRKFSDIVCDVFRTGYLDLLELGVTVTGFKKNGGPNDANKINPHLLTAETFTKEDAAA